LYGWQNAFPLCYDDKTFNGSDALEQIDKAPVFAADDSDNLFFADHWENIPNAPETIYLNNGMPLQGTTAAASAILKFSPAGQLLWKSIHSDIRWSSLELNSNGMYYYGTFADTLIIRSRNGDSTFSVIPQWDQNFFIAASDTSGNFQWVSPFGGSDLDISYHLRVSQCSDNFYFIGLQSDTAIVYNHTNSFTVGQPNRMFAAKQSPASICIDPICVFTTGIEQDTSENSISLFPNPANETITIFFKGIFSGPVAIEIFDISGRKLLSSSQFISGSDQLITVNTGEFSEGMYVLSVTTAQKTAAEKIIISR
jgi:hypothetical protein